MNNKGFGYGFNGQMTFMTILLLSGIIFVLIFQNTGVMGVEPLSYSGAKGLIDTCEKNTNKLFETTKELEEIKSIDIQRAYTECREYLVIEKNRNNEWVRWFLHLIWMAIGSGFTWIIFYKKPGEKNERKKKK